MLSQPSANGSTHAEASTGNWSSINLAAISAVSFTSESQMLGIWLAPHKVSAGNRLPSRRIQSGDVSMLLFAWRRHHRHRLRLRLHAIVGSVCLTRLDGRLPHPLHILHKVGDLDSRHGLD